MPPDCHHVIVLLEHVPFLEYREDYRSWKGECWELCWGALLQSLPLSSSINNYEMTDFSFYNREDDPH